MKKILAVLLSTSIMLGSSGVAEARDHGRRDRHDNYSRNYDRHDRGHKHHNNDGWGVALGVLAVGAALAIASDDSPRYVEPAPVYYAPPPRPVYVEQSYVERTYRPVTVERTVYEPRTEYSTYYQPEYRRVTRYAEAW